MQVVDLSRRTVRGPANKLLISMNAGHKNPTCLRTKKANKRWKKWLEEEETTAHLRSIPLIIQKERMTFVEIRGSNP